MAIAISRHFDLTLTQGSNDAFVQGSIVTDLEPADGLAYVITRAEIVRPVPIAMANSALIEWSVTRDTKSAIALMSDPDCMYHDGIALKMTTSGATMDRIRTEVVFEDGLFVVEPYLYVQLDSANTTATNTAYFRFWYEQQKLSEVEILRLLNNV